jgi:hypothetical protein
VTLASKWPGDAVFDESGQYRYVLSRDVATTGSWEDGTAAGGALLFVLLNPSTADADHNDPTIAKCCRFAISWRYRHVTICNIFALRATDPKWLTTEGGAAVGPLNDAHITEQARRADLIVCAWGAHGAIDDRGYRVFQRLSHLDKLYALSFTKSGQPGHPLYLKGDSRPIRWHRWMRGAK